MLHRMMYPDGPPRRLSPESNRISRRILASSAGFSLTLYVVIGTRGTEHDRLFLAALLGGWLSLLVHELREATRARNV